MVEATRMWPLNVGRHQRRTCRTKREAHLQRYIDDRNDSSDEGTDLDIADKLHAYEHKGPWTNRLILGDSLQVMNSLLE